MVATLIQRTGEMTQYLDHDDFDELVLELDAPWTPSTWA
jgi:hypothetical protein